MIKGGCLILTLPMSRVKVVSIGTKNILKLNVISKSTVIKVFPINMTFIKITVFF